MSREVGIIVKATDQANAVFSKIGGGSKKLGSAVENMASRAKKSFGDFKMSIVALNQGMELAKKAFSVFDRAVGGAVRKALDFRFANDGAKQSITALTASLETTQARLGDLFLPLLHGIADVLGPINKEFQDWIAKNEKLIAGGIIEWVVSLSTGLVSGVATAVLMVSEAWAGWNMIIIATQTAWNEVKSGFMGATGGIINAVGKVRGELSALAGTTDELAPVLKAGENAAKSMAIEYEKAAAEAGAKLAQLVKKQADFKKSIEETAVTLQSKIGQAGASAMKHLGDETKRAASNAEELAAKIKAANDAASIKANQDAIKGFQIREMIAKNEAEAKQHRRDEDAAMAAEAEDLSIDQAKDHAQKISGYMQNAADTIRGAFSDAFSKVDGDTRTAGQRFGQFFGAIGKHIIDMAATWVIAKGIELAATRLTATQTVTAHAAEAGAGAAAAVAPTPFIGPILAVAAMAAVFGTVIAGMLGAFAMGGVVPMGGRPGVDSVPIMVAGSERILTRSERVIYESQSSGGASRGSSGGGGAASSGPAVTQNFLAITTSRAQLRRIERDVYEPERRRMRRNGLVRA